jgi:small subunit ribosomal protein S16
VAVKIRLTRIGKKKQPSYRVVVMDSRKPRDGAYIEQIGRYDARQDPSLIEIDNDRALYWLNTGAQPTDRAKKLLEISGAWTRFRIDKGDIHTIEAAPAAPQIHVVEHTAPPAEAREDEAAQPEAAQPEAAQPEAAQPEAGTSEEVEVAAPVAEAADTPVPEAAAAGDDDAAGATEETT